FGGLGLRIVSGGALGAVAGLAAWRGFPWYDLLVGLAAVLAFAEWRRLTGGWRRPGWLLGGLVYLGLPVVALLWLRHDAQWGMATILWLFASVAAIDTGAYFAGKGIGGPKLAPLISPNKPWAGLAGGAAAAGACGLIAAIILGTDIVAAVAFSVILAPVAQIGDIGESAVKRYFGVKDSGSILPGHGGILDRIDGLLAAAVFVAAVRLLGGGAAPWH
ncbi:MAG TPA: phosphatidate cytidylyltransferase, partial [Lacipirellulaceae bacterium]|nr:phosphatidate cytidylyltransferase [Lacipirellulaceae bacterium]